MIFTTSHFLVFFPICIFLFYLSPTRLQRLILLLANYVFYMWMKPAFGLYLLFSTAVTYLIGRAIQSRWLGFHKLWVSLGAIALLGQLVIFKYTDFLLSGVGLLFGKEIVGPGFLLPIGISFYSFSAAGYLFDVYRKKISAEENFLDCALFLSFFPCILSGPIPQGRSLLPQFKYRHKFSWESLRRGLLRFVWGAMKKMVIADSLVVAINTAYAVPEAYTGGQWLFAVILYSLYIYFDFDSYSDMAIGAAWILGFTLPENFAAPYTARTVQGFWKRWHMSLTGWFKEYLFFPLGGSRVSKRRVYLNIMIVFAVSGLWHGAAMTFVVWGLLNGIYQVIGQITAHPRQTLRSRLNIAEDSPVLAALQIFFVFAFITAAWIFFRATSLNQAIFIIKRILLILRDGFGNQSIFALGLSARRLFVTGLFMIPTVVADIRKARGCKPLSLEHRPYCYCLSLAVLLVAVVVFGAYGEAFDQSEFVYFKF